MATVYKIHPAIGIGRIGNHPSAFFIGPESPGSAGVEIGNNGAETEIVQYKDGGKIKRQAVRFRVFRFNQDDSGKLTLVDEVTADEAKIEWRVDLCNRKAALRHTLGPAQPRNTDIADLNSLIIKNSQPVTISGKSQGAREFNGSFRNNPVYLGELRTDAKGRLLVLGGHGVSKSPDAQPLLEFANNDGWHDDVADGPVTAVITLPGQEAVVAHHPSWVTFAPPDFAPQINGIVTLYDIAVQAAIDKGALSPDATPSFRRHIKPMIERAASLFWVNGFAKWKDMASLDMAALADTGAANAPLRKKVGNRLRSPGLSNFALPVFLRDYVDKWVAGNFLSDLNGNDPAAPVPDQLDRAALEVGVGNNFFPGIEAGENLRDKDVYARPLRLDHTNLGKIYPGCLTEVMAVPWQADFRACDGGSWWPSQRPDFAMTDGNQIPGSQAAWEDPIPEGDYEAMIEHVQQLGFIVSQQINGKTVFVEQERDPAFPRAPLVG